MNNSIPDNLALKHNMRTKDELKSCGSICIIKSTLPQSFYKNTQLVHDVSSIYVNNVLLLAMQKQC